MNEQNELVKKVLKEFSQRPIAYYPIYSEITEHLISGILLSQLVYWHYKMDEKEFYKTDADFADELKMSIKEVRSAKKILIQHRVIEYKAKGVPARTWYKIDMDRIRQLIASYSGQTSLPQKGKLEPPEKANKNSPKGQTIKHRLPETTTKNKANNKFDNINTDTLDPPSIKIDESVCDKEKSNNIPPILTKETSKDKVNTSQKHIPKNPDRQELIDKFHQDYMKTYGGDKIDWTSMKEQAAINKLLLKNKNELHGKYATLLLLCKNKQNGYYVLLPSMLLCEWNKLVVVAEDINKGDDIEVVAGSEYGKRRNRNNLGG